MEDWHHATEPHILHPQRPVPERIAPVAEASLAQARRLAALADSVRGPIELCRGSTPQARGLVEAALEASERATGQSHELWLVPSLALVRNGDPVAEAIRRVREQSTHDVTWILLESTSPDLLASIVQKEGLLDWSGALCDPALVLMIAHGGPPEATYPLGALGMRHSLRVPASSVADVLGWCRHRQPGIENRLGMAVDQGAIEAAVRAAVEPAPAWTSVGPLDDRVLSQPADLERALSVLKSAAAMVRLEWYCGPVRLAHLNGLETMDQRSELVGLARGGTPEPALDESRSLERAALEIEWHENPPELVLDQAAVLSWLEAQGGASSASDGFWYDARCLNKEVTRE